ncbi:MAG: hypothetical protein HS132_07060 [Planctomycetia bacterium]|nr:hypothetical protein [Planctomycetia bacterium]
MEGYIFTVSAKGDQSTVMVGSESDGTSGSETSDGTVNGRDLSGSAWVVRFFKVRDGKESAPRRRYLNNRDQLRCGSRWQRELLQKSLGYLPGEGWQMILYILMLHQTPQLRIFY